MKKIVHFFIISFFILYFIDMKVYANEINLAVTPSYIKDITVERGSTSTLSLSVSCNGSSKANYKFDVTVSVEESSDNKLNIDAENLSALPSKWLLPIENNFELNYDDKKKLDFKLNIPENALLGEHIVYIKIQQKLHNSGNNANIGINFTPVIKIPVFIFVMDKNISPLTVKNSVVYEKLYISDNMKSLSVKSFLSTLLSSKNIHDKTYELFKEPYKLKISNMTLYDIPKSKTTKLGDVIVYSAKDLSPNKFALVDKKIKSEGKISTVTFENNSFKIVTNEEEYSIEINNEAVISSIKDQVTNLSTIISYTPTIDWFLKNINVINNINYKSPELFLNAKIKNTGEVTIIPVGIVEVYDSDTKIDKSIYQQCIIPPTKSNEIRALIPYDLNKYKGKKYSLKSIIVPYTNGEAQINSYDINIFNVRYIYYFVVLVTPIITIFILIKFVIPYIKNKRKQKELQ